MSIQIGERSVTQQKKKTLRVHYIMHADFEGVGCLEKWAMDHQYSFQGTRTYKGERLPDANQFDMLIIMGGPQSPLEIKTYPYLRGEIELITQSVLMNKHIVGFCLGAQLIGEALGAKTRRSPEKEVGIFPIELTTEGQHHQLFQGFPSIFEVFHWHNDMPGIPDGASVLATSLGCPRQIIRFGHRIYGFQCHLEHTVSDVRMLIKHAKEDLKSGKFVQKPEEMLKGNFSDINKKLNLIMNALLKL